MRTEEKMAVKNSVGRLIFVGISVLIQVGWILFLFIKLNKYSTWISLLSSVIAFFVVLRLYGKHTNAAFKMPWIMLILVFPVMGLCLYLMVGRPEVTRGMQKHFEQIDAELDGKLTQDTAVMEELEKKDLGGGEPVPLHLEIWEISGLAEYGCGILCKSRRWLCGPEGRTAQSGEVYFYGIPCH